jgi:hypothetical protein
VTITTSMAMKNAKSTMNNGIQNTMNPKHPVLARSPCGTGLVTAGFSEVTRHGRNLAIVHATTANTTNPHNTVCEPLSPPKTSAISNTAISDPP